MSKPSGNGRDPHSPVHYAWVDLEGGDGQWTPGEKIRIFIDLLGDEIGPKELAVLVQLVDQVDGAAFLRREWVQLKIEDWAGMLAGASARVARRVKASLLEKELVVERGLDLIPPPEKDIVHGNVKAYRPQTPAERERRRFVRDGSLHVPKYGKASENGEEPDEKGSSTDEQESSPEAEEGSGSDGAYSPELPSWLSDDWTPPTSNGS